MFNTSRTSWILSQETPSEESFSSCELMLGGCLMMMLGMLLYVTCSRSSPTATRSDCGRRSGDGERGDLGRLVSTTYLSPGPNGLTIQAQAGRQGALEQYLAHEFAGPGCGGGAHGRAPIRLQRPPAADRVHATPLCCAHPCGAGARRARRHPRACCPGSGPGPPTLRCQPTSFGADRTRAATSCHPLPSRAEHCAGTGWQQRGNAVMLLRQCRGSGRPVLAEPGWRTPRYGRALS